MNTLRISIAAFRGVTEAFDDRDVRRAIEEFSPLLVVIDGSMMAHDAIIEAENGFGPVTIDVHANRGMSINAADEDTRRRLTR